MSRTSKVASIWCSGFPFMDTMQFLEPYKIFFNNKPHDQNFTIPGTYRSLTIYKVSEISLESDFLKKTKTCFSTIVCSREHNIVSFRFLISVNSK